MKRLIFALCALGFAMLSAESYEAKEVSFINASADVTLSGTLTVPKLLESCPAVILLHGSRAQDRDYTSFDHEIFRVWADFFSRHGIAVLRFDVRGNGQSTGDYSVAILEDLADDAIAAYRFLKTQKEIDSRKIGMVGFSVGGEAATLAAMRCSEVDFLILMAMPCATFDEIVCQQEQDFLSLAKAPQDFIDNNLQHRRKMFTLLRENPNRVIAESKLRVFLEEYISSLDEEKQFAQMIYGDVNAQVELFNASMMRSLVGFDPAHALSKISAPILAIGCDKDFCVSVDQNLHRIAHTLEAAGHAQYKIQTLPNLNHLFQTCKTGALSEYGQSAETTAPIALDTIFEWINDLYPAKS